jgi:hypothetical protein
VAIDFSDHLLTLAGKSELPGEPPCELHTLALDSSSWDAQLFQARLGMFDERDFSYVRLLLTVSDFSLTNSLTNFWAGHTIVTERHQQVSAQSVAPATGPREQSGGPESWVPLTIVALRSLSDP